jgi:cytochrome c-type biogenesis protein CcmH
LEFNTRSAVLLAVSVMLMLTSAVSADELDDRARQIAKQLQCPVCESVSVADSPSDLATQMRGIIRARLEAGESEPQIIQYFVERYGEQVLVEPPRRGLALAVWVLPVLVLLGGGAGLFALLRAWTRPTPAPRTQRPAEVAAYAHPSIPDESRAEAVHSNAYAQLARLELERVRRELEA